tara:strand:- start:193 stop:783 length:591 start_codon:yes stop_codon:yes gene_type:complete
MRVIIKYFLGILAIISILAIIGFDVIAEIFNLEQNNSIVTTAVSEDDAYEIKPVNHEEFRLEILDIVNSYRSNNNVMPLELGDSSYAQQITDGWSKNTLEFKIPYSEYETLASWNTYFDPLDVNQCKVGLAICTFNPFREGLSYFRAFINNEAKTEFHESYKTEDLLSTNIKTLHIGISVRETYPIESNYLIQAKN